MDNKIIDSMVVPIYAKYNLDLNTIPTANRLSKIGMLWDKIKKPRGIFRKCCPECGTLLLSDLIYRGIAFGMGCNYDKYYHCPNCDYEYVTPV